MTALSKEFYEREDVIGIAKELIGCELVLHRNGHERSGIIIETEAYNGVIDKACHAFNGKRTPRNETMYHKGSLAYVYLCYGIHHLFNVVCSKRDDPKAVLIRAIEPLHLSNESIQNKRTNGPGKLTKYLGISRKDDGIDLCGSEIFIRERPSVKSYEIKATPRIGVDYAGEDAFLPYRFIVKGHPGLSPSKFNR
jgi:DNA-3-methyladenine glycosylase